MTKSQRLKIIEDAALMVHEGEERYVCDALLSAGSLVDRIKFRALFSPHGGQSWAFDNYILTESLSEIRAFALCLYHAMVEAGDA